ncbi:MAG: hypothetical protein ACLUD2_12850 [Clostridium sp.]
MEQAYLCTEPVVRVRRENDSYVLTYKSKGLLAREEYNLPLTKDAYAASALKRRDGITITKDDAIKADQRNRARRIELGVFPGPMKGLMLARSKSS